MTAASSTPGVQSAVKKSLPTPTPTAAQQQVLDRIAAQRERLRARRAAYALSQALAAQQRSNELGSADDPLPLRAAAFARAHPLAVAAMAGAGLVAGPRRLLRWAGVLLPMLIRLKR